MASSPFLTFNFRVSIRVADGDEIGAAEFSECDGLELTIEPKTIREGGNNFQPIHLMGPVSYGQLSLKRGMSEDASIWDWMEETIAAGGYGRRAEARVELLSTDRTEGDGDDNLPPPVTAFRLTGCLPTKVKCPSLSAKDGGIAIEELQISYETLRRLPEGE